MSDKEEDGFVAASVPVIAGNPRDLLACRECGLVKSEAQFREEGCENCEGVGIGADEMERICTPDFSGMIAIMNPEKSWCAKWTRKKKCLPGCYALKVEGAAPE